MSVPDEVAQGGEVFGRILELGVTHIPQIDPGDRAVGAQTDAAGMRVDT